MDNEKRPANNRRFGFITPDKIISGRFFSYTQDTALRGLIDNPWISHNCEKSCDKRTRLLEMLLNTVFLYHKKTGEVEFFEKYKINKNDIILAYSIENNYISNKTGGNYAGATRIRQPTNTTLDIRNIRINGKIENTYLYEPILTDRQSQNNMGSHSSLFVSVENAKITKVSTDINKHPCTIQTKNGEIPLQFLLGDKLFPIQSISQETLEQFKTEYKKSPKATKKTGLFSPIFSPNDNFLIFNQNRWTGGPHF
jgi:hypothetical protein